MLFSHSSGSKAKEVALHSMSSFNSIIFNSLVIIFMTFRRDNIFKEDETSSVLNVSVRFGWVNLMIMETSVQLLVSRFTTVRGLLE